MIRSRFSSLIQFSDTVKILGATMGPHIKATSKSCFYHIRSFRYIRSPMDHIGLYYSHLCCFCFDVVLSWLCSCPTVRLSTEACSSSSTRTTYRHSPVIAQQSSRSQVSTFMHSFIYWFKNSTQSWAQYKIADWIRVVKVNEGL